MGDGKDGRWERTEDGEGREMEKNGRWRRTGDGEEWEMEKNGKGQEMGKDERWRRTGRKGLGMRLTQIYQRLV